MRIEPEHLDLPLDNGGLLRDGNGPEALSVVCSPMPFRGRLRAVLLGCGTRNKRLSLVNGGGKGKKQRKSGKGSRKTSWTGSWLIHFFQRHGKDDPSESVPARDFLDSCPVKVAAKMAAVLKAVANAPPPAFSGGGKWEAMHGKMSGFYEVRVDGPGRHHYRLFCILERDGQELGLGGPSLVLISGKEKPFRSKLSEYDYEEIRRLGSEYRKRRPRSVAR